MGFLSFPKHSLLVIAAYFFRTSLPSSTVLYLENKLKNYDDYLQIQNDYGDDVAHRYSISLYFIRSRMGYFTIQTFYPLLAIH